LKDSEIYDMFRGRIVIPIFDVTGRVTGFGGRAIERDAMPKYINSPESQVFSKRSALFGIDKAKRHITDMNEVFIVEGYFDFISLYQRGFQNIVSTLGTAVTEGQLTRLRNYSDNITLMLDGDEAGVKSALRLIGLFSEMDINGSMVVLPEGHDPDSFVRKEGIEGLTRVVKEKKPILDYFFDYAKNKYGVDKLEGKMRFIRSVMPHLETIRNGIHKRLYVKRLSELTNLDEQSLWDGLQEGKARSVSTEGSSTSIIGRRVVGVLVDNIDLLRMCKTKSVIDHIREDDVREVLTKLFDHFETNKEFTVHKFVQALERDDLRELVLSSVMSIADYDELESKKVVADYFTYLERNFVREESHRITERLLDAEKRGDEAELMQLLHQKRQILELLKVGSMEKVDHG